MSSCVVLTCWLELNHDSEPAWPELQLPGAGELWDISGCPLKSVREAQSVFPAVSRREEQHWRLEWNEHVPRPWGSKWAGDQGSSSRQCCQEGNQGQNALSKEAACTGPHNPLAQNPFSLSAG